MRRHRRGLHALLIAIAVGTGVAAVARAQSASGGIDAATAVAEPADPDDEDDIRADDDPNDVGQQALPPDATQAPGASAPGGGPDGAAGGDD